MSQEREVRIRNAVERVKSWMNVHGAEVLVENLARGASGAQLDADEQAYGFRFPADLRALWSVHAGQHDEQNGFVGAMDLLGPGAEKENVAMFLGFLREDPDSWEEAGVTPQEVQSDAWVAFAGRGYADLLVVSASSGRVFSCAKDSPPFHLVAESILDWLEAYADRVEAGTYHVEEGFGDCYLARDEALF
ncbi:SMI1/KNR4 family protein [Pendulispora rubella]|uniref:SMI1/KNR4 family protein n=1 Tax=Pendulispora rubella TaxID=2741070 RepID=A0ABZ2LN99_9BACT